MSSKMIPTFWLSLLFIMLIPIILLPDGCNAAGGSSSGQQAEIIGQIESDDENENNKIIDKNAIGEVTQIFNRMSKELQKNKQKYLADVKSAQSAIARFVAIFKKFVPKKIGHNQFKAPILTENEKEILVRKILNIFKSEEAKNDDTYNDLPKLVDFKIRTVANTIKFYEPNKLSAFKKLKKGITCSNMEKDSVYDPKQKQQKSQRFNLEDVMAKQKKQMEMFKKWLEKVQTDVEPNSEKSEKEIAEKILFKLFENGTPFVEFYDENESANAEMKEIMERGHSSKVSQLHQQQQHLGDTEEEVKETDSLLAHQWT